MRLRQLAISQSVVFFAPPEVHQSILNFRGQAAKGPIDSHDVIVWLLEQTCCSIEQLQPLYISQGLEYCRRRLAAQRYPDAAARPEQRKAYLKVLEQPEQYSLENLYAPDQKTRSRPVDARGFPEMAGYVGKLDEMKKVRTFRDFISSCSRATWASVYGLGAGKLVASPENFLLSGL